MIAIDLTKQQALDADLKATQQINVAVNLAREGNANKTTFFIIEEVKETILDFSQGTVKVLWMSLYNLATGCSKMLFCFDIISI